MKQKSQKQHMEKMKQQYLHYFQRPSKTHHQNRNTHLKDKQNQRRPINHNYKDYHQISENSRLLKRILNPKRDPTIMQSLRRQVKTHKNKRRVKPYSKNQQQTCDEGFFVNNFSEIDSRQRKQAAQSEKHQFHHGLKEYSSEYHNFLQSEPSDNPLEYRNSRSLHTANQFERSAANSQKKNRNIKKEAEIKQREFQRSLQNERMGKRIINTRSVISTIINNSFGKTSLKFAEKNGSSCHNFFDPRMNIIIGQKYRKINNGVKVFFNNKKEKEVINSGFFEAVEDNEEPQLTVFQTYGNGPTILRLSHFELKLNPKLKEDTVIALQLMKQQPPHQQKLQMNGNFQNNSIRDEKDIRDMKNKTLFRTYRFNEKEIKRKIYEQENQRQTQNRHSSHINLSNSNKMLSHPFTYKQMIAPGFNIKFAVNLTTQGQYLPLRIWQYNGVQSKELGIVDINVIPYLKKQISKEACFSQEKLRDGQIVKRKFFQGYIQTEQMRKSKKQQIFGTVNLKYQIYNKKFRKKTQVCDQN